MDTAFITIVCVSLGSITVNLFFIHGRLSEIRNLLEKIANKK